MSSWRGRKFSRSSVGRVKVYSWLANALCVDGESEGIVLSLNERRWVRWCGIGDEKPRPRFGSCHQILSSQLSLPMLLLRLEGCICRLRSIPRRSASSPRASSQSRSIHQPTASTSATPTRKGKEIHRWPGWIPTVGLELHVQLRGNVKLLSRKYPIFSWPAYDVLIYLVL